MPRWDTTKHPKYRVIEMQIIRSHLKKHRGIETDEIGDDEFMDMMVQLQKAFDDMRDAVMKLNHAVSNIPRFMWTPNPPEDGFGGRDKPE